MTAPFWEDARLRMETTRLVLAAFLDREERALAKLRARGSKRTWTREHVVAALSHALELTNAEARGFDLAPKLEALAGELRRCTEHV